MPIALRPADRPLRAWQRAAAERRLRPRRRRVPRLRHARGREDDVRAARRAPDARRGAGRARGGRRADDAHLPPVGGRRRALRDRPRAQPAERRGARSRATATASPSPTRPSRPGRPRTGAARRGADAADRRRAAPHGRARGVGRSDRRGVRAPPASGCCSPARRSAPTTRRSRGSATTTTASRAPTTRTATPRRCSTACAARSRSTPTTATWSGCQRRPPPPRRLLRRAARRRVRAPAAHGAGPGGRLDRQVLRDADARLATLRAGEHPDAGGLVVAIDKEHAERLAHRLEQVTGERPEIVTSDEPDASQRIAAFAAGARAVARVGADGLRGRRHPAPARRRLRDGRAHRAVLPPGRRALRPPHAGAAASR